MKRTAFLEILSDLADTDPTLLWEERTVEAEPAASDFVLTTAGPVSVYVWGVRAEFDDLRVLVDDHTFDFVPAAELRDFLAAALSGQAEVIPGRGLLRPARMVVRSGQQVWES
ncbi:hypothetical protein ACFCV3_01300 [Kribbella sp. NPDC056345]|uniref:hypothetical protein n=1 Tax=Kribbella sp. NPDC056345 TaxID=3345789 RepID=UPI0035D530E1